MSEFQSAYYQRMYESVRKQRHELLNKLELAQDKIMRLEYTLARIINVAPGSYEARLAKESLKLEAERANHPN